MAKPGATLTPHFRDFLPGWVARQPRPAGPGVPAHTAVGLFRLEDPAGEVGIETHLVTDGPALCQIPMTYRGAALAGAAGGARHRCVRDAALLLFRDHDRSPGKNRGRMVVIMRNGPAGAGP